MGNKQATNSAPARCHFDRLLIAYLLLTFTVSFVGSYFGPLYLLMALMHLVLVYLVLRLSAMDPAKPYIAVVRWLYPLLFLAPLHYEIDFLAWLFHGGEYYDHLVLAAEGWLFGGPPHKYLADLLHGPFWRELFHLLYLVSYPLLAGGLILAWWRDKVWTGPGATPDYPRYAFILLGGFLSYLIIFILFPVEGPLDDRFLRFHEQGLIGPLIDFLNRAGHSRGGALPSFQVGGLVISYLLWRPTKPAVRYGLIALILAITISTTYGAFHYALDAVAGLITGAGFYLLWDRIYRRLKPERWKTDKAGGFPAPEPQ
ncbi:MAG: phosphatase PAP2 family protein [Candidatus Marinimicrobia bacterium]|nr:phosphatase PAP2 family protein [Candidatus Neomarinimicrobiota bacterium]